MFLTRGTTPAWMELIKLEIQGTERERLVAAGSFVDFLGNAFLPILFGMLLDASPGIWKELFFLTALIGLLSTFLLLLIPKFPKMEEAKPLRPSLLSPWKESWNLLRRRPDFAQFQMGFMLGGGGLMLMQTTLPSFFVADLELSYTEILLALAFCKGIGFALASPFWVRQFSRQNLFSFGGVVAFLASLFPLILLCGHFQTVWIYSAYFLYGIMQAGSELAWHLSGPHFSQNEESSPYSSVNILTVGLRGLIIPALGSLIFLMSNATTVFLAAALLSLLGAQRLWNFRKESILEQAP
jgi:MFS family permease